MSPIQKYPFSWLVATQQSRWHRDGSEYPWRAKLRGPSFVNLQILPEMLRGYKMSDVIAVLGSLDFVVGEVDR
jgi:NADH:ubiquinone oxidoreductase subunit D